DERLDRRNVVRIEWIETDFDGGVHVFAPSEDQRANWPAGDRPEKTKSCIDDCKSSERRAQHRQSRQSTRKSPGCPLWPARQQGPFSHFPSKAHAHLPRLAELNVTLVLPIGRLVREIESAH